MTSISHQNEILSLLDEGRSLTSKLTFSTLLGSLTMAKFVIFLVGFSEGLTHLAALAIYYLFKDDLYLSPAGVSAIFAIPALPWFLKPLFAFCSDSVPIKGMRRKPYLLIFSTLEIIGFIMLATMANTVLAAATSLFLISLSAAFCSSIAEALVVQTSDSSNGVETVSDYFGSKAFGALVTAYFSGSLLERYSKQDIFLITSFFPLLVFFASLIMYEEVHSRATSVKQKLQSLIEFLRKPIIWGPALYIVIYTSGPDYDDAMFFYFTNRLGFSPTFMGSLRLTYGIAGIIGIILYRILLRKTPFRDILLWTTLISLPIYVTPFLLVTGVNLDLGISNRIFALSGGFLIEAISEVQLLPLLVMTTQLCPKGLEGSVYAVMMSIRNLGTGVSKVFSAGLTYSLGITSYNFSNLGLLIWLCAAFLLLPLLFLHLVINEEEYKNQEIESQA
ncbi:folate biopterin transporter family protein [Cryptosporidium andersoni]|uniref:Folate biopterin transporter family protein n=1 Tax=Cryptosporidium andersoni TaxID=117008 RepID=A0A1J4MPP8_9CRYT|nr:folate biopterin transporter family protein [Cryptosporidium andersoni]